MPSTTNIDTVDSLALLSLKCASRTFDLSSRLAHVSMRDQIVRAQLLARDLRAFDEDARRVLVVGAGVAGTAFAMAAAAAGFNVVLLEAEGSALKLQSAVTTRYVGPFMYEWPSAFHDDQAYPPKASRHLGDAPVTTPRWGEQQPVAASAMAGQYLDWLKTARAALGPDGPSLWFDVDKGQVKAFVHTFVLAASANFRRWMAGFALLPMPPLGVTSACRDPDNPPDAPALAVFVPDYVVLAAGVGQEKTSLPAGEGENEPASGRRFWQDDDLKKPLAATQEIGVFGGGDGALQDVLRLLTQFDHPLELIAHLRQDAVVAALLDRERDALLAIEQQSRLIGTWTLGNAVFAGIDAACREVAERLAAEPALRKQLAQGMRPGRGFVRHFVRKSHFTKAYLLNRFAVHLIASSRAAAQALNEKHGTGRVGYQLYFGAEAQASAVATSGRASKRIEVEVKLPDDRLENFEFDDVVVRLQLEDQAVGASQMIQLSARDNGLRTAIAQVPLPFVMSHSNP